MKLGVGKKLALLLISVAPLLMLEFGLRIFHPLPGVPAPANQYHRFLPGWNQYGNPPLESSFSFGPLNGVEPLSEPVDINRYGFLYDENKALRTSENEVRIAVLGGSTAECFALRPENRWPAVLERLLGDRHPDQKITVLNMGLSDQGTWTHIANLAQLLPHLDLDLIVPMLGANDVFRARQDYEHLLSSNSIRSISRGGPVNVAKRWLHRTQIGRHIAKLRSGGRPYFAGTIELIESLPELPFEPAFNLDGLKDYETAIVSIVGLATAHGTEVFFVNQPMLWKQDNSADELSVMWLLKREHEGRLYRQSPRDMSRQLGALNDSLIDTCNRRGFQCLDLAAKMPRSLEYFYDDVHFNDAGARFVAESIAEAIPKAQLFR